MIAVCSVGDCEILLLRRGQDGRLSPVFHTEMQRIDGNAQSPLQLARVDDTVDPDFDESIAIEVIERGSAVHCVSAFEGDIVVLGSDGVFDNLFIDEILMLCEQMIPAPTGKRFQPVDRHVLGEISRTIVQESHNKTRPGLNGWVPTPIGTGGKIDDTSCVVAQVVEWTEEHGKAWKQVRSNKKWKDLFSYCSFLPSCKQDDTAEEEVECISPTGDGSRVRNFPTKPNANSFSTYWGSFHEASSGTGMGYVSGRPVARRAPRIAHEDRDERCSIM